MKLSLVISVVAVTLGAGCGGNNGAETDDQNGNGETVEASCNFDAARLEASAPSPVPEAQNGELAQVIIGAWQHTHTIENGGSPEPLDSDTDIRFVLADEQTFIFCQSITGFQEPDSNEATYTLDGNDIVVGGTANYTALAWTEDVMVWNNNTGAGGQYILQRR